MFNAAIASTTFERGYNVVIYEGPGHRALVNEGKSFVAEWEKAVNPIVDFIVAENAGELSFIDKDKIGLVGMSLGGCLSARAVAFEPRPAAVMCIDGVYSMLETAMNIFPEGADAWARGDAADFYRLFEDNLSSWSTTRRWFHDDLEYIICVDSAYEAFRTCEAMTLANGVAQKIRMPVFISKATEDMFSKGQPARVVKAIGPTATLKSFGAELGGHLHCQVGAFVYLKPEMLE